LLNRSHGFQSKHCRIGALARLREGGLSFDYMALGSGYRWIPVTLVTVRCPAVTSFECTAIFRPLNTSKALAQKPGYQVK
jgi:hypothetical protein